MKIIDYDILNLILKKLRYNEILEFDLDNLT